LRDHKRERESERARERERERESESEREKERERERERERTISRQKDRRGIPGPLTHLLLLLYPSYPHPPPLGRMIEEISGLPSSSSPPPSPPPSLT
jgi:hypothetical protein